MIANRGFTLTEIAVAVAVLALLLGGLLIPLSTQIEGGRQREAQRQLENIREALIGYALANGRLPCPAEPNIATGGVGTAAILGGTEMRVGAAGAGTCHPVVLSVAAVTAIEPQRASGVLPATTLGVPELDPWGQRFTYIVDHAFADELSAPITGSGDAACSNPNPPSVRSFCARANEPEARLELHTRTVSGPTTRLAEKMVAIVISHGRNGYFGWRPNNAPSPVGLPNSDESLNAVIGSPFQSSGKIVIDRPQLRDGATGCNDIAAGQPLCEFDDQIIGISRSVLVGRMAAAGRL